MRRMGRAGIIGFIVVGLVACGESPATQDVLFLQSRRGVAIVTSKGTAPSFQAASAVPSHDWSKVIRTEKSGNSTRIVAEDPSSGFELWSQSAPGRLELKAVSRAGDIAVLEPASARYEYRPTATRFVIVRRGTVPETIELDGNFAAEAFSTDGQSLFVVQYFPARNPNRYQVRRLDLKSGTVDDVYSVDAELQEAMRGTARIQTMSPDGTRLYTLYSLRSAGTRYAFVHVLSLDELWAHCVDLPPAFAESPQSATALALEPSGKHLYVANARARMVAEIDTKRLAVARTASVDLGSGEGAHAAYGPNSTLLFANGSKLVAIGTNDLEVTRSWETSLPVTGLQAGNDRRRVYVGQGTKIAIFDALSGKSLGQVDPPGIGKIGGLGKVMRALDAVRTEFVCAC